MIKSVYFSCAPYEKPEKARYQHTALSLAEGLRELGIATYSNIRYWKEEPAGQAWTLNPDVQCTPADCDAVVFNNDWLESGHSVTEAEGSNSRRIVFLDAADGWRSRFPPWKSALVLRSHYNNNYRYTPRVTPWAFGLTRRILEITGRTRPGQARSESLLVNHRLAHGLRVAASSDILPRLGGLWAVDQESDSFAAGSMDAKSLLFWEQTGRRHYPQYYRRLTSSRACFAFGGFFAPRFSRNLDSLPLRIAYRVVQGLGMRTRAVVQFDSWRFWESLAAGCLTLHVDLDAYGCRFPVQPVNWKHYVGFDFRHISEDVRRLRDSRSQREDIACAGQEWVLQNYSPKAVAERFLGILEATNG